jgi:SHS2 domain-containing protein
MVKGYRYVNHTADVEFVASGATLECAFKNALLALFDTLSYTKKVSKSDVKTQKFTLKVKAETVDKLLWYALQDAISLLGMKCLFAYKTTGLHIIHKNSDYFLVTQIHAKARRDEDSKLDVKGVSLYDLKVEKKGRKFFARAVVDV